MCRSDFLSIWPPIFIFVSYKSFLWTRYASMLNSKARVGYYLSREKAEGEHQCVRTLRLAIEFTAGPLIISIASLLII